MRSSVLGFLKHIFAGSVRFGAGARLLGRFSAGEGPGQEIKLGNGLSLEGDTLHAAESVSPAGLGDRAVLHDGPQALDDTQKAQARGNIEAGPEVLVFAQPPENGTVTSFTVTWPEKPEAEGVYVDMGTSFIWGDRIFGRESDIQAEENPLRLEEFEDLRGRGAAFRQSFFEDWQLSYSAHWEEGIVERWLLDSKWIGDSGWSDPTEVPAWQDSEYQTASPVIAATGGTGGTAGLPNQTGACGDRLFRCVRTSPPLWKEIPFHGIGAENFIRHDTYQQIEDYSQRRARLNLAITEPGIEVDGDLVPDYRCILFPYSTSYGEYIYSTDGIWNQGTEPIFVHLGRYYLPEDHRWHLLVSSYNQEVATYVSERSTDNPLNAGAFTLISGSATGNPILRANQREQIVPDLLPARVRRVADDLTFQEASGVRLVPNEANGSYLAIRNITHDHFQKLRIRSGNSGEFFTLTTPLALSSPPANGVAGTAQVETVAALGTVASDGLVVCSVTGNDGQIEVFVPVSAGDEPSDWAIKVQDACLLDPSFTDFYSIYASGSQLVVWKLQEAANDPTLNIAFLNAPDPDNPGIMPTQFSTNAVAGVAPIPGTTGFPGQHAVVNESAVYLCIRENPVKWIAH